MNNTIDFNTAKTIGTMSKKIDHIDDTVSGFFSFMHMVMQNELGNGERRPMNAICDTTAKSETLSVKGCKVKITYASADTDCLDAIQKLLQTTILRTAGHTAA